MIPIEQIITSTKLMLEIGQTAQYDAELRLYLFILFAVLTNLYAA